MFHPHHQNQRPLRRTQQVERLTKELSPYKKPVPKKSVPTSRAVLRQPRHAAEPQVEPAAMAVHVPVAEVAVAEVAVAVAEVENPFGLIIPEAVALMELPEDLADSLPAPVPALNPAARRGRGGGLVGRGRGPPLRHSIGPSDKNARRRHLAEQMKLHAARHTRQ